MKEHETTMWVVQKEIDRNIAPVVIWLSKFSGVYTLFSCERNEGTAEGGYVLFHCNDVDVLRHICFEVSGCFWGIPARGNILIDVDEFKNFRYCLVFPTVAHRTLFLQQIGEPVKTTTPEVKLPEQTDLDEIDYMPTLVDRGDGVKGHYCIGRKMKKYPLETWEYYNESGWAGFGELFKSKESAEAKLSELRDIVIQNHAYRIRRTIANKLGLVVDVVLPPSRLIADLGADSLDTVELIMAFEDIYKIEIPTEDAEKINTVQDAINYITNKI